MNSLKNKVNLIGNLGFNPEIKTFDDGKKLAKVTLATNETYRNQKGDRVDDTQWHNLIAWGKNSRIVAEIHESGQQNCRGRQTREPQLSRQRRTEKVRDRDPGERNSPARSMERWAAGSLTLTP